MKHLSIRSRIIIEFLDRGRLTSDDIKILGIKKPYKEIYKLRKLGYNINSNKVSKGRIAYNFLKNKNNIENSKKHLRKHVELNTLDFFRFNLDSKKKKKHDYTLYLSIIIILFFLFFALKNQIIL